MIDIQKQHPDKTVEVWFQDEARVGQQGRLTRIWERKESGKNTKRYEIRIQLYLWSCLPTKGFCRSYCYLLCKQNSHATSPERHQPTIPEDRHGVLLMDRAPWHKSLETPPNMTIFYLPPYSPELNPHENIWNTSKIIFYPQGL